ncbi:OmpA family protein [Cytophaga aurantiaca]|uniref:OmpA family protein n=1 Tax=Cytophaga aurantiaca TaxID=29530 RepID=UPI000366CCCB|nr:OmpA family protein [Cytophaga aurantiaca]
MVQKFILLIAFLCCSIIHSLAGSVNATALKNGCIIVQKPSTFFTATAYSAKVNAWSVYGLQDQNPATGWCSGAASKAPYVFVFELSEDFLINKLVFNTFCQKEYTGISAKDIKVEFSTTSAKTGYVSASPFLLEENKINAFEITGVKARWIKLTITSNHGNPQWTELMEFEAWGDYVTKTPKSVSTNGVWNSNFDWVSLNTNSSGIIYGCYKWSRGELYLKHVDRTSYTFTWKQVDDGQQGWCVLVMNKEGTKLNGIWGVNSDTTKFGCWELTKTQNTAYACPNDLTVVAKKEEPKIPPINVMIEVVDVATKKVVTGTIDIYTRKNYYSVVSADGMYTADIKPDSFIVVKTALPNYYPTVDTFLLNDKERKSLYTTHTIEVSKLAAGNSILLNNILFSRTSSVLLPSSLPPLNQLIAVLNQYPNMIIELSGHTDNVGDTKQNVLLSQQRVATVKNYLVENGISADRIKTVGYGEKYPIASNDGEQTRKFNRRVEMRIIKM